MVSAALLTLVAVSCLVAMEALHRAKWPSRGPYTAVIAWQALGLAWGVSTIGALLAYGLSSYELGAAGGLMAAATDLFTVSSSWPSSPRGSRASATWRPWPWRSS